MAKSARERRDEYLAEQEALDRLGQSQSGVKFAPAPTVQEFLSTGYVPSYGATPAQKGKLLGDVLGQIPQVFPADSVGRNVTAAGATNAAAGLASEIVNKERVQGYTNPLDQAMGQVNLNRSMDDLDVLQQQANTRTGPYAQGQPASTPASTQTFGELVTGVPESAYRFAKTPEERDIITKAYLRTPTTPQESEGARLRVAANTGEATAKRLGQEANAGANARYSGLVNEVLTPAGTQKFTGDGAWRGSAQDRGYAAALDALRPGQSPSDIIESGDGYAISPYTTASQANATERIARVVKGVSVPTDVQSLANDIAQSWGSGTSQTYGKTPQQIRSEAFAKAQELVDAQKEKLRTSSVSSFQNYGDAFQYAQLNGMGMSDALKFASDWAKMNAPQGQHASSGAAPRDAGKAQTNEQLRDSTNASVKRIAQVAREAVQARMAGRGAGAASGATPPAKRPMREIEREDKELGVAAKKQQARMTEVEGIAKSLKLRMDAIGPAMMELTEEQQAKYDALSDAAKRKFVSDLAAAYLKRQGL